MIKALRYTFRDLHIGRAVPVNIKQHTMKMYGGKEVRLHLFLTMELGATLKEECLVIQSKGR
jgi:hypothetical protein